MEKTPKSTKYNVISSRAAFFLFWLATVISFLSTLDPSGGNAGRIFPNFLILLFFVNILLGIVFFFAMFIKPIERFKQSNLSNYIPLVAVLYFLFYVVCMSIYGYGYIASVTKRATPTPTPVPIISSTPTPILTPTPVTNTYVAPIDSDPIVNCTSSYPSCNGSSIRLPRSQCSQITCCQIGNTWSVYPSSEKCKEAQNGTNPQPVPQQNTQQSAGNNTYCWNNAYGYGYYTSSGDQCNLDNAKSSAYKICMDTQKIKSNTCDSACQTSSDQAKQACSGLSSYPVDYYGQCLNGPGGVSDQYASCLSKCTDQYAQDIKQCSN